MKLKLLGVFVLLLIVCFVGPSSASICYTGTSFDTAASGNTNPQGITMNDTYFWIVDDLDNEVYQYYHNGTYTGTSFDTGASGNTGPQGITMNDTYFWIINNFVDKVYQYYHNGTYTGTSWVAGAPGNTWPYGITMDDTYFWIVDDPNDKVYQYYHNGTYTGTSFDTIASGNTNPHGITMDDTYFWIVDDSDNEVYQYYHDGTYTGTSFDTGASGNTGPQGITMNDTCFWIVDDPNDEVYQYDMNIPPTIPSISSPTYDSYLLTSPITFEVNSTDTDGDSLTYYIYGDTVDGTTLINISTTGNYSWNIGTYGIYYWKTRAYDGCEYSDNTSLQKFTFLIYPDLQTPTNESVHTFAFPPLLHDLTFSWENVDAPAYKYQIARDESFNIIAASGTTTGNVSIKQLTADNYWWRIYSYDPNTGSYSDASDVWQFTINETTVSDGTAIDGVVYEELTAGSVAVEGTLVNIWNATWSWSVITGENGYFYFSGLTNQTYSLQVTKTGYTASSIELVTASHDATTTRNILLQSSSGAGQEYVDHYVNFIVKSIVGTLYEGVEVNVYLGDAVIPQYTGYTGTDGGISFELNENQGYRITFIDATQNIDETRTIYPIYTEYSIIVFGASLIPDDRPTDAILFGCYGEGVNLTHGYINVSFNDTSGTTTLAELWINDINQTNLYYFNTTDSENIWSQVVDGGNASYIVVFKLQNTGLDEPLTKTRTIHFTDTIRFDLGFDEGWKYHCIAVMLIVVIALLGSRFNAETMSVITILTAWLMVFAGWLTAGLSTAQTITIGLMLVLGTLLAFGAAIRSGENKP